MPFAFEHRVTFKPALIPSLMTLLILPVLLFLGFWQLDRANQKEQLQTAFQRQMDQPFMPMAKVDLSAPDGLYRKVRVSGHYDADHQILLDNQIQNGRPGYHVLTPLRTEGKSQAILINRGWVQMDPSRRTLPDIETTTAKVTVKGRVAQPANPGLKLGSNKPGSTWPWIVQFLDYQQAADALGYAVAPSIILLDPSSENGYKREWRPQFAGLGPERHRGYAVQWFALAAALIVIYIVVNVRRYPTKEV